MHENALGTKIPQMMYGVLVLTILVEKKGQPKNVKNVSLKYFFIIVTQLNN